MKLPRWAVPLISNSHAQNYVRYLYFKHREAYEPTYKRQHVCYNDDTRYFHDKLIDVEGFNVVRIHVHTVDSIGNVSSEPVHTFECNIHGDDQALLDEAAIYVEEKGYVLADSPADKFNRVERSQEDVVSVRIAVDGGTYPVFENDSRVGWNSFCPYCGAEIYIDENDISPSASDPTEWVHRAFADFCHNCMRR